MREIFRFFKAMRNLYQQAQELARTQLELMTMRAPVPNVSQAPGEEDFLRSQLHRTIFIPGTLGSLGDCPFRCLTNEQELMRQLAEAQRKLSSCSCITNAGISSDAHSVDFFRSYWGTCGAVARMSTSLACLFFGISHQLALELADFTQRASALEVFSRFYAHRFFVPETEWIYETSTVVAFWGEAAVRKLASQSLSGETLLQAWNSVDVLPDNLQRHVMTRSCRAAVHDLTQTLAQQGFHSTSLARQVWLRTSVLMATAKNAADVTTSGATQHYPSLAVSDRKVIGGFFERAMVRALGGNFDHKTVADAIFYAALLTIEFFGLNAGMNWLDYFERQAAKLLKSLPGGAFFEDVNYCGESNALPAQITIEGR